jgi:hypothetical protein
LGGNTIGGYPKYSSLTQIFKKEVWVPWTCVPALSGMNTAYAFLALHGGRSMQVIRW